MWRPDHAGGPARRELPDLRKLRQEAQELSFAHRVVRAGGRRPAEVPSVARPPALVDDGQIYAGHEAIEGRPDYLIGFAHLRYKYQSDTCYVPEDERTEERIRHGVRNRSP